MDVPIVKDAVGETVQAAFETFLRTYVIYHRFTRHNTQACGLHP